MYLKALEIQGFKSFADRTRLTFEKDITAIVGPNGSGKSNISDAVLWVMGEQRTKTLRGSKMEDVIFGGTAIRSPMGFAEVSLIIDNSARIFDSDSSEVELTRRYYRSGESEYYINKEQVRLKDLNSLLMDTGLGRDGYSIIGQGKIADIVSSKSTDRREIFDEAAGISRYRYRKEEAERRLEKTDENLTRINDRIEELELQVGPLKQQSEVAKKYLLLRDELRVKEISAWLTTLDKIHEKTESVNAEYTETALALEKAKAELESLYASTESLSDRMHRKDTDTENARERLSAKESERAECESSVSVLKANIKSSEEAMLRLADDIREQEKRSAEIRENITLSEKRISEIAASLAENAEKLSANDNVLTGCKMKIHSRETALQDASEKANRLEIDGKTLDSRIAMLSEMERDFEGYSRAVKTVMKESSRGNVRGVHGPVSNLIRTDNEFALAVETALGAAGQNIVIDSRNDGRSAIEMLKRTDSGRATFLPLDTIKGAVMKDAPVNDPGFVGVAYDLVKFDERYEQIVASILGKTVVVETLSDAIRVSKAGNDRFRIVTLDGQMINIGGSMTGGSAAKGTGILSRSNELEALKIKREELRRNEKSVISSLDKARNDLAAVRYDYDMAMEDRNVLSAVESSLTAEKTAVSNTVAQFRILLESISGDSESRRSAAEEAKAKISEISSQIGEKEKKLEKINNEISVIRKEIDDISKSKLELEGKRTKAEKDAQQCNTRINELERTVARIEQKKAAADMEEKQILDKLWENYELSHTAAQELRQPVENLQKTNREIGELRRQISALGTPNIGAIEEYERVSSRYEMFTSQRDDIEKAKDDLLRIIRDLTKEMKALFTERFKLIDEAFRTTFRELFGGGKAALILEDEENVLECGIEIKCQPPGKAITNISLMSGGEMAFVAIALYFAILKVRPTPFCVMDEIEAALDEANVGRFADYMRTMSLRTQFLVITHRRGTMEEADMLYGVTMQEKGVSTVLELDLDQAKKAAEE
ncbi:MAG: AAA family ATPase [Eubacteriales bacterium]|nr:AAA family ATPase [Eubacteriales bacterium]